VRQCSPMVLVSGVGLPINYPLSEHRACQILLQTISYP